MAVRVRFAPSPTGYLHVGGARTALVNWLYARKHGGTFILRIEDTDEARSTPEMTEGILEGLKWLGMDWDEGPFYQSERQELYRETARKLLASGHAYRCFCTKEALDTRRNSAGKPDGWKYDRLCLGTPREVSDRRAAAGELFVVRCRIGEEPLAWDDIVKGPIRFEAREVEDFVLLRSDATPTYHLSVVSDDAAMGMTHVIRGEDHISNTPKQVALYRGLGLELPIFGHLPLILGMDKKKLSKRHGVTSVLSYRDEGILPLALFNFLAQLGADLGEDPFLTLTGIMGRFEFDALKNSASVFDRDRLAFINAKVIGETPACELGIVLKPFLEAALPGAPQPPEAAVRVCGSRAKTLVELAAALVPFVSEDFLYDPKGIEKARKDPSALPALEALLPKLEVLSEPEWEPLKLEEVLRSHADASGVKAGTLIHPIRLFLTGRTDSPGIFDVLHAMGKEKTFARLRRGLEFVRREA
jgi:glutamyl-tRNA synthetase